MCRMLYVVIIYLCKHNIKYVLANILKQSIQSFNRIPKYLQISKNHSDIQQDK